MAFRARPSERSMQSDGLGVPSDTAQPDAEPSDAELIDRAKAGDATGFAGLYARHHLALYRTALAMTRHQARAEELVQEAFLRAYRHMGQVVLAPSASLRPWLQRILIHLVYDDAARRMHATVPLDTVQERVSAPLQVPTERRIEARELRRTIAAAIQQLPEKHRLVVVLFYLHDLDVGEIAETLGVPPGTVKSRLFYGRSRLRELLASEDPTAEGRVGAIGAVGAVGAVGAAIG